MRFLIGIMALLVSVAVLFCACDTAKETADDTAAAGEGAVGVAEKMSQGTVGDALEEEDEGSSDEGDY